jgi:iron complex transport system permease protein
MRNKAGRRFYAIIVVLVIALVVAGVASLMMGRFPVSVETLVATLFGGVTGREAGAIVLNVRLPRVALSCLVGGALSVAGACFQSVFRNPMASPNVLGASQGAAAGAALAILCSWPREGIIAAAFVGALAAVGLVLVAGAGIRGDRVLRLILAGILVGSLFGAAVSFLKLVADPDNQLPEITYWMMGSFAKTRLGDVLFVLPALAIGAAPIWALRWRINLLTLSEDEARAIGVNSARVRVVVVAAATLLTAASVSVSGLIGWVGLVVPHIARRLVGSDCRRLVPTAAITGALFLLVVDDVSRTHLSTEIPIGILTAVIGAPVFLWFIRKK